MILRLVFLALVLVPFALVCVPIQLFLVWLWPAKSGVLPRCFFILLARGLGLRVTLKGLPFKGPALIVANHISWLDIPAIASQCDVRFVAKSDVARYPLVGPLAWLARTIFVDRTRRLDTGRTAREMGAALAGGDAVVLFAEGTSDIGTHVLPFRSALVGATQKAIGDATGEAAPIVPMAIAYRSISGLPLTRHERPRLAWVGDMAVGDNIAQILGSGPKEVVIAFGAPLSGAAERKAVTKTAEKSVREMLVALNRGTPLPSEAGSV